MSQQPTDLLSDWLSTDLLPIVDVFSATLLIHGIVLQADSEPTSTMTQNLLSNGIKCTEKFPRAPPSWPIYNRRAM